MLKLSEIPEDVKKQIREDLAALYQDVAQQLAQLSQPCTACGLCCQFAASEHRLYATTLEFIYLLDKYRADPLPEKTDICPFLRGGLCSVRDRRMLGCRTYFRLHTREERIKAEEIYQHALAHLKKLHHKYQIEWNYQDCMPFFQEQFGSE